MDRMNPDCNDMIRSLRIAFDHHPDLSMSLKRIRGMLSHLPGGNLQIKHYRGRVSFFEKSGNTSAYLRKDSEQLYQLARKRYLIELMKTMEVVIANPLGSDKWHKQFERVAKLIHDYDAGNLDTLRIVLTSKQYEEIIKTRIIPRLWF